MWGVWFWGGGGGWNKVGGLRGIGEIFMEGWIIWGVGNVVDGRI